ncbi:MAG: hypothetical protein RLZZ367_1205 [Bacteroidota bacterium]|jgi:tetratricopeptide (TPR) repeat protein
MISLRIVIAMVLFFLFSSSTMAQDEILNFMLNTIGQIREDTTGLSEQMGLDFFKKDIDVEGFNRFLQQMAEAYNNPPKISEEQEAQEALEAAEYQKAIDLYEKLLVKAKKSKSKIKYATALNRLSVAHNYVSNYNKALQYALQSLDVGLAINDTTLVATNYLALGDVYRNIRDYEEAEKYFVKTIALIKHSSPTLNREASFKLATIYANTQQPLRALALLNYCKQTDSLTANYDNLIDDYTSLGYVYFDMEPRDTVQLYRCIMAGNKYVLLNSGQSSSLYALIRMAGLSRKLGLYQQANAMLYTVNMFSLFLNRPLEAAAATREQAQVYADMENYKQAYKYFAEYYEETDSLFNNEKNRELRKLMVEYETTKKEQALAKSESERKAKELELAEIEKKLLGERLLNAEQTGKLLKSDNDLQRNKLALVEKERQRNAANLQKAQMEKVFTWFVFAVIIVIGGLAGSYYLRQRRLTQQYVTEALTALKSQMERHFTYGTISSVRHAIAHQPSRADEFLKRFEDYIRSALEIAEQPETTLQQELTELNNYIQFEKLFPNNHFDYRIEIDEHINTALVKVPSLILQPLVENAIKHGFQGIDYPGLLSVCIKQKGNMLICTVSDNGKGRRMNKVTYEPGRTSKGTKITLRRIQLYNQIKNRKATFEVKDLPQGVEVLLTIPGQAA